MCCCVKYLKVVSRLMDITLNIRRGSRRTHAEISLEPESVPDCRAQKRAMHAPAALFEREPVPGVINGSGHEGELLCETIILLETMLGSKPGELCTQFLEMLDAIIQWNNGGPFPSNEVRIKYTTIIEELI
jgi:hypothetical protein